MALRAQAHPLAPRLAAVLAVAVLVAAVLTGCGSSTTSSSQQSAADFIRHVTTEFSLGQTGPLWDELHPADQAIVSRARYTACHASTGFDLQKFQAVQTYADTVDIAGKPTASTAVSVRVTADDGVTIATMHAIKVSGKWHWILSPADYAAYKKGKCPAS